MPPAEPTTPRLGHLLRTARAGTKLSQQGLANLMGTTQSTVSAWESGAVLPRLDTLLELSRHLGVDVHPFVNACEDDLAGQLPKAATT